MIGSQAAPIPTPAALTNGLTRAVGDFASTFSWDGVPAAAIQPVRNAFCDYAAVTILGRNEPVTEIACALAEFSDRPDASRVLFGRRRAKSGQAALINATSGHACDYDDVGLDFHPAHPTVVMAPALMAEGERLGKSGRELMASYLVGYEVWGELGSRDPVPHNSIGWHPTAVFGAVATAAAVANLNGLTPEQATMAVAIAGSFSSGIVANFGSMTKPLQVGWAAHAGIEAVRYAKAGLTASMDAMEHPRGFLAAVSPNNEADLVSPADLGTKWWILERAISFKLYPMCYGTHRALEGMINLVSENAVMPDSIEHVAVHLQPSQANSLLTRMPGSPLEAKFSMEFAMAAAAIARQVTFVELTETFFTRPDVRDLMARVELRFLPDQSNPYLAGFKDRIEVRLKNGNRLERPLDRPKGNARDGVSPADLFDKFLDCTRGQLASPDARDLFDTLQRLETLSSLDEIPTALD